MHRQRKRRPARKPSLAKSIDQRWLRRVGHNRYLRLHALLRRDGLVIDRKKTYRLDKPRGSRCGPAVAERDRLRLCTGRPRS
jgi:hypothetical protein